MAFDKYNASAAAAPAMAASASASTMAPAAAAAAAVVKTDDKTLDNVVNVDNHPCSPQYRSGAGAGIEDVKYQESMFKTPDQPIQLRYPTKPVHKKVRLPVTIQPRRLYFGNTEVDFESYQGHTAHKGHMAAALLSSH